MDHRMTVQTPCQFTTPGMESRAMKHHDATTLSNAFGSGASVAIKTWDLAPGDVLNIRMGSGVSAQGLIETFGLAGLEINIDGDLYHCRPWKAGDGPLHTDRGFTSNWTII